MPPLHSKSVAAHLHPSVLAGIHQVVQRHLTAGLVGDPIDELLPGQALTGPPQADGLLRRADATPELGVAEPGHPAPDPIVQPHGAVV